MCGVWAWIWYTMARPSRVGIFWALACACVTLDLWVRSKMDTRGSLSIQFLVECLGIRYKQSIEWKINPQWPSSRPPILTETQNPSGFTDWLIDWLTGYNMYYFILTMLYRITKTVQILSDTLYYYYFLIVVVAVYPRRWLWLSSGVVSDRARVVKDEVILISTFCCVREYFWRQFVAKWMMIRPERPFLAWGDWLTDCFRPSTKDLHSSVYGLPPLLPVSLVISWTVIIAR